MLTHQICALSVRPRVRCKRSNASSLPQVSCASDSSNPTDARKDRYRRVPSNKVGGSNLAVGSEKMWPALQIFVSMAACACNTKCLMKQPVLFTYSIILCDRGRVVVSGHAHAPAKMEHRECKACDRRGIVCQALNAPISAYANFSLPKYWCFSPTP